MRLAGVGLALLALAVLVQAYPSFVRAIPNGNRVAFSGHAWPGVGHSNANGGGQGLNPFGVDFERQGNRWTRALCAMDSDGDGRTNGQELGDPDCTWELGDPDPPSSLPVTHPGIAESDDDDDYDDGEL